MELRTAYVCALSLATAAYLLPRLLPGADLGVATVDSRPAVPGYAREDFGGWATGTRERVKQAQSQGGTLFDPYAQAPAPARVEVDHVFPLAAAWDMGAYAWPAERKAQFANDPLNLVATDRALNQAKSDKLPSEWLPPKARCDYSKRLAAVARKYELALPARDAKVMGQQCRFDLLRLNH